MYVAKSGKITVIDKVFDEVNKKELAMNWSLAKEGALKELKSFQDTDALVIAPRSKHPNVLSSRWVWRWKAIDGKRAIKARLTVRGFEDNESSQLKTMATTATRWSQRMIISIVVQRGWELLTADVSTAFLQGLTFEELGKLENLPPRQVAFDPPRGSDDLIRNIWKDYDRRVHTLVMRKAVYGLKDAPRAWRMRLDQALRALGGMPTPVDPSLYVWFEQSELVCVLSTHVDDLKLGGVPSVVDNILESLTKQFGKLKIQRKEFEHCGLIHEQSSDLQSITIHQAHYAQQLKVIPISADHPDDEGLNEEFSKLFMSVLGALSWLTQTRSELCIYVQALQRVASKGKYEHLRKCNKLIRYVKRHKVALRYRKLKEPLRVVAISDAAFRREDPTSLAMRGAMIVVNSVNEKTPGGDHHIIEFYSKKQRRIVRSTFGAELNALEDAFEMAKIISATYTSSITPTTATSLSVMERTGKLKLEIDCVVDARSVHDALIASETKIPTESSLILVLLQLKENMMSHCLKRLWWVATTDMLSDGLNKGAVSRRALLMAANDGCWKLNETPIQHHETRYLPL